MKLSAAYALLFLRGNASPSVEDFKRLFTEACIDIMTEEIEAFRKDIAVKPWHQVYL